MIRKSKRFNFLVLFLGSVLMVAEAAAVTIQVVPDRNPVRLNESFTLTFTAISTPDGDPDFSVLQDDFEILNQSRSSNISLINGEFSKSISWTLNLLARKSGRLLVPPVSFGRDRSSSIPIEVLDAAGGDQESDPELLLEVSAEPENPYVQAQVIYTVRFLRRVDIAQASLTEPDLEDAVIQKLADDKTYSIWKNAIQYHVTERKYAIFPQQSGLIAIPPLELKAEVVTGGRRGFFSLPSTRMRRIQSNAVALNVRPVPEQFEGKYWLPAEQVVLEERWSNYPPSVRVGEPLTRTLKLTAVGAPLSLLPEFGELQFEGPGADTVKQYPDQPVLEEKKQYSGIVGSREQKVALIPSISGDVRLRGEEIVWWNTKTDRMEIASLPAEAISAKPAAPSPVSNAATDDADDHDSAIARRMPAPDHRILVAGNERGADGIWFWVSVFLSLGWGATLLFLARNRVSKKKRSESVIALELESKRRTIKSVKKACQNQAPAAVRDALLAWGGKQWPESRFGNLTQLADKCDGSLAVEIENLNRALYGRGGGDWDASACLRAFSAYVEAQPKKQQARPNVELEPLFKA